MAFIPVVPSLAAFNASAWLGAWTENGGTYVLPGDMLHLRRHSRLDRAASSNLDQLRDSMLRSGGGPAIADLQIRRRNGTCSEHRPRAVSAQGDAEAAQARNRAAG